RLAAKALSTVKHAGPRCHYPASWVSLPGFPERAVVPGGEVRLDPRPRRNERQHLGAVRAERWPTRVTGRRVAGGREVRPGGPHGGRERLLIRAERFLEWRVRQVEQVGKLGLVRRHGRAGQRRRIAERRVVVVELIGEGRYPL